ncbi:hypothetical protein U9M48_030351 [Paspalum notatum var. saurae]|uniref:Uncharacterized protein n=1 Tax=Paspalum notatum var. saurae TaxID=547442 RepID=A0AAQ3U4R0_PASNO
MTQQCSSVHLLHLALLCGAVVDRGHVGVVFRSGVLVDVEAELEHPVDPGGERVGVVEAEPRCEQRGLEEQEDEVPDGLVVPVCLRALPELLHDAVVRVDLHGLLGRHVRAHAAVAQRLRLHDPLHVGRPPVLAGDEAAGRVDDAVRHDHLLHAVAEDVLDHLAQLLELFLPLLAPLLGLLVFFFLQLEAFLGGGHQLLAVVLLELSHGVLVDGVHHEEHLVALLLEPLQERRVLHGLSTLAGDVVDVLLPWLHPRDVVLEAGHLLAALRRVVPQQVRELGAVLRVLVDPQLDVLGEGVVELAVIVLAILRDVEEHLDALLHQVLADDLEDLVLLQRLAGDVEGQVVGVDDALDEAQPLGDELLAVVHDEDAADVELDVVELLAGVEEVERRAAGHEEDGLELQLPLHREVLHGEVVLPVVGQRLVEGRVLLACDLLRLPQPDRLLLVDLHPLVRHLLHLLLLLLVLLVGAAVVVVELLDLALLDLLAFLGGFILIFVVADLLLGGLLGPEIDRIADELGVLLDEVLEAALLQVLELVVLEEERDLGAPPEALPGGVERDGEGATGLRLPHVLLVVVVLGGDHHPVRDEVGGVEADAELADHGHVGGAGRQRLHELLGARPRDRAQVVHKVGFGHPHAGVDDGEGLGGLVGDQPDEQLRLRVQLALVRQALETDLVKRLQSIGITFIDAMDQ